MARSYWGKILRVNLTTGKISVEEPDALFYRRNMGGWNFILEVLLREVPVNADPLGPENKLVIAPGVVTGLAISGASRNAVGAKSPLTGGFGAGEVGGFFGAEFKRAGFDGIIFEGASPKPVYLSIKDGHAELRDATHLWGKTTKETLQALQEELGDRRIRCSMIGPGGENLVRYACVMNETKDAAGRSGLGAVMGSKKLKAIAVRGTLGLDGADPDKIREMARDLARGVQAGELAAGMHKYGTGAHLEDFIPVGNLPIRNFRDGEFPAAADISANTILEKIGQGMEACYACAVRCKKVVKTGAPYNVDPDYGGPEYETIGSLGSCCGVEDIEAIAKGSELCNAYSIDTIATGVSIAFAMESYENGLLTKEDTGGIDLRFGNAEAMLAAIEAIAKREGIGNLLAEGTKRAAEKIGKGAERFAMHVKGQEYPMHEPRFKRGLALGYAVSPTGADHCHALHDSGLGTATEEGFMPNAGLRSLGVLEPVSVESLGPDKVRAFRYNSVNLVSSNCIALCQFVPWTQQQRADIVNAATGWDVSPVELFAVGERALALARLYNLREGFTAEDDHLAERSYGPTADGALVDGGIDREELREAIDTYYGMMGWDDQGVPTAATLHDLGISWAVAYLPK
ncbi:MAG TPA: aldehyde ferredoxin oxidoreductase family protein [Chloroflexi bacterium]|jgi:aldehyde:ferredoxin oxidoreductase|nr:aldehyde ferredoxin oxidoreductase family protein [Chloroflexota bacterium]